MVHKALEDVVQSVFEQAYSPPLVLQDLYWFDVLMNVDSNEVAPDKAIMMMAKRLDIRAWSRTWEPSISKPLFGNLGIETQIG